VQGTACPRIDILFVRTHYDIPKNVFDDGPLFRNYRILHPVQLSTGLMRVGI
jgi:hypothetical protein